MRVTYDRELAAFLYELPSSCLRFVGLELGRHPETIRRGLIALGIPRRRPGGSEKRALPACPVCGRPRATRFRPDRGRVEHYCRYCQARSGRVWRFRHPEKVAGYRLARRSA